MDAFEGIHSVRISPSPPPLPAAGPGYEVLRAGRSGVAVYSSSVFFGTPDAQAARLKSGRGAQEGGCVVGR